MTGSAAARMARTRARRKAGQMPVTVVVDEMTIDELIQAKLLDPMRADDKPAIAAALERMIAMLRATASLSGPR